MKSLYLLSLIILGENVYSYKPDYAVKRQSKSIFSNKRHTETITPARYNAGNRNIKYDRRVADDLTPEHYFPEVEYPANIMEASKPYYFRTAENSPLLTYFTDDVKTNFKSFSKPAPLDKVNSKIVPDYTALKVNVVTKRDNKETINSTVSETSTVVQEVRTKEDVLNTTLITPAITQDKIDTDNENLVMSEKMISPESLESIEYVDYETDCSQTCSFENSTEIFYDEVDIIDPLILDSASIENRNSTKPLLVTNAGSFTSNSTSDVSDAVPENPETSVEPEILPIEKNKTSVVTKAPMRLGVGPLQNIKRRKLIQQIYNTPPLIS